MNPIPFSLSIHFHHSSLFTFIKRHISIFRFDIGLSKTAEYLDSLIYLDFRIYFVDV